MKTLNEYLALPYRMELVKDPDEGGFVVSFPDLPGTLSFLYYTWYRIWCQVVSAAGKNCRGHTAPAVVIPKCRKCPE